jgi:hypothetical protein
MLKKTKPKVCRICKTSYLPRSSLQVVCSPPCAIAHAEKARQKREKVQQKAERKVIREKKQKLKKRSDWIKEAQIAFNGYIRARDYDKLCISCDSSLKAESVGGGYDAGHMLSRGAKPHLRFDERNCHGQCKRCNRYLSGNVANYRQRLIIRIGLSEVEALESNHEIVKWTIEDLMAIKRKYRLMTKELLKQRELLTNP